MRDASDKVSRIHRDISVGNIILVQEVDGAPRKGCLIDWETSDKVDEQGYAFDRVRTGTWRFMSTNLLEDPEKGHTLQDDMESLLYVILYCSLLHLPHSMHNPAELHTFIYTFFDYSSYAAGRLHGGDAKMVNAGDRSWIQRIKFDSENISDWLNTAMNYHYPPRHLRREWWDRWSNPDYLDTFWGAFLERRDLERADAVNNKQPQIEPADVDYVSTYGSQESEVDKLIGDTLDAPDNPAAGNYNVPLALIENNFAVYGRLPKNADSRYERYGREGVGFALGPVAPRTFLEMFCPCPADLVEKMPTSTDAFIGITALNGGDANTRRCPGYTFPDTSTHADTEGSCTVKPDVLCYANEHVSRVRIKGNTSRTHMGFATFFIEVKRHPSQDFFQDPYEHWGSSRALPCHFFKSDATDSELLEDFGQQVVYATELARIMRWDRAGLIATRQFDIHDNPEILCEFVWRYAHMSEAQRGMDMTVIAANEAEETLFRMAIESHVVLQLGLSGKPLQAAVCQHYQPNAVCAISVFDVVTREEQRYLVSRPLTSPLSMTGRATRSYWAVDARTGRVACLKDTWRLSTRGAEQEGVVITSLAAGGVRNIPAVVHHGDVLAVPDTKQSTSFDHAAKRTTITHQFVNEEWVCEEGIDLSTIVKYTQYRLVVSIAGYPLHNISGTAELLPAGCRVLQAIIDAFDKKRVHRNVHPSSIILYREKAGAHRDGFLLDWDLSWNIKTMNPHAHIPFDAMWQFMSISIQSQREESHSIQDDMESLLYVLLYCGLRWLDNTVDPKKGKLSWILGELFDWASWCEDEPRGAPAKAANAMHRRYTAGVRFKSPALHKWLNRLMDLHHPREEGYKSGRSCLSPEPQLPTTALWLDPKALEVEWIRFLADEELEPNDRVVRSLPHESRDIKEGSPHPATIPSFNRSTKRVADELHEGALAEHSSKKRRVSAGAVQLHTGTLECIKALTIPKDDAELKAPSTSSVAPPRKTSPQRRLASKPEQGEGSKKKRGGKGTGARVKG
ncbi:hypothetical protein GY45DRAFT_1376296 [Cubamyces sp. BRFM 1775]|nr:hypothetical protein GY45DRAFT_1376296 [Cubamyces sp. BRFM 1775]